MHPLDAAGFWVRLLSGSAAGLVTWAACWCIGVSWLDKCLPTQDRLTRRALGAAFGFAVVASMTAILGLFDAEHYGAYGVVAGLLVAIAVGIKRSMTSAVKTSKIGLLDPRALRFSDWLALAAIGLAVFTGIVAAALPAVWWDPIAYHLPFVERALRVGAFAFDPAMTQLAFPLLGAAGALPEYAIADSAGSALVPLGAGVALVVSRPGTLPARTPVHLSVAVAGGPEVPRLVRPASTALAVGRGLELYMLNRGISTARPAPAPPSRCTCPPPEPRLSGKAAPFPYLALSFHCHLTDIQQ